MATERELPSSEVDGAASLRPSLLAPTWACLHVLALARYIEGFAALVAVGRPVEKVTVSGRKTRGSWSVSLSCNHVAENMPTVLQRPCSPSPSLPPLASCSAHTLEQAAAARHSLLLALLLAQESAKFISMDQEASKRSATRHACASKSQTNATTGMQEPGGTWEMSHSCIYPEAFEFELILST